MKNLQRIEMERVNPFSEVDSYLKNNISENSDQEKYINYNSVEIDTKRGSKLLLLWQYRSHKAARAHYTHSLSLGRQNLLLTILNAVFSILILFFTNAAWISSLLDITFPQLHASFKNSEVTIYMLISSAFALSLVVTTILQYILKWSETANDHRAAGSEFANLQRKIERYLIIKSINMSIVHNINREYNHISKSYPLIKRSSWQNAGKEGINKVIKELESDLSNKSEPNLNN